MRLRSILALWPAAPNATPHPSPTSVKFEYHCPRLRTPASRPDRYPTCQSDVGAVSYRPSEGQVTRLVPPHPSTAHPPLSRTQLPHCPTAQRRSSTPLTPRPVLSLLVTDAETRRQITSAQPPPSTKIPRGNLPPPLATDTETPQLIHSPEKLDSLEK